jgi:cell wall-associated NlpC family hydrolase
MDAVAYAMIVAGALLVREVAVGRAANTVDDVRDLFVAALRGDMNALRTVVSRRGKNLAVVGGDVSAGTSTTATGLGATVLAKAHELATRANNTYVYGATGPNAYDCSGLVWRALKDTGIYTGARFTTHTFANVASGRFATRVDQPQPGDIVLWPDHMGFYIGPNRLYSALDTKDGIIESSLTVSSGTPSYWRITGSNATYNEQVPQG